MARAPGTKLGQETGGYDTTPPRGVNGKTAAEWRQLAAGCLAVSTPIVYNLRPGAPEWFEVRPRPLSSDSRRWRNSLRQSANDSV